MEPIDSDLLADLIEFLKEIDQQYENTDAPSGIKARALLQRIEETA